MDTAKRSSTGFPLRHELAAVADSIGHGDVTSLGAELEHREESLRRRDRIGRLTSETEPSAS